MGWFSNLFGGFGSSSSDDSSFSSSCPSINPANGMPMIDNTCIDIEGNPYGTDNTSSWSMDDTFSSSSFDSFGDSSFDSFSSSSFDDSF